MRRRSDPASTVAEALLDAIKPDVVGRLDPAGNRRKVSSRGLYRPPGGGMFFTNHALTAASASGSIVSGFRRRSKLAGRGDGRDRRRAGGRLRSAHLSPARKFDRRASSDHGDPIPLNIAALVGCGVMTGVGAVFNAVKVEPGSTVAVVGCGGIGPSAVNGAALAGASRIIAIDTVAPKLEKAKALGVTNTSVRRMSMQWNR